MWWLKASSTKNLNNILKNTYTKRKSEHIQNLINHNHPDFKDKSEEEIAGEIAKKEAADPLGARKLYAKYKAPSKLDDFADSEDEFIKKRDESRFNRIKKEYEKGDKTFYQAIGEIASDNTVIINSIENSLIGMLPDNYTKGITTSEIIRIAQRMDPEKYNGRQEDLFKKVYKRVDSAFNSFEKFSNNEPVSRNKRISHHGNRINDSLSLLMDSLEVEETHKESEKPFKSLIDGLFRINSDQSVSSHAERVTEQRRQIFPHIHGR